MAYAFKTHTSSRERERKYIKIKSLLPFPGFALLAAPNIRQFVNTHINRIALKWLYSCFYTQLSLSLSFSFSVAVYVLENKSTVKADNLEPPPSCFSSSYVTFDCLKNSIILCCGRERKVSFFFQFYFKNEGSVLSSKTAAVI